MTSNENGRDSKSSTKLVPNTNHVRVELGGVREFFLGLVLRIGLLDQNLLHINLVRISEIGTSKAKG